MEDVVVVVVVRSSNKGSKTDTVKINMV